MEIEREFGGREKIVGWVHPGAMGTDWALSREFGGLGTWKRSDTCWDSKGKVIVRIQLKRFLEVWIP